jgi:hypothetical protein
MKHLVRFRALMASVLVIGALAVMPSTAQTSDVGLTINPTGEIFAGGAVVTGELSCSSLKKPLFTESLVATIEQSGRRVTSSFGIAICDPSTGSSFWGAVFLDNKLHPGPAAVTIQLTLDDGTVVTAAGTVRLIEPRKPVKATFPVDDTYVDFFLSDLCGFPVQAHDVGRVQQFFYPDRTVEQFFGTTTYTNLDTGTTVVVEGAPRVTFSGEQVVFRGLNYRIRTSSGKLVSAGRGVSSFEGETATPHFTHLTEVICGLLAAP